MLVLNVLSHFNDVRISGCRCRGWGPYFIALSSICTTFTRHTDQYAAKHPNGVQLSMADFLFTELVKRLRALTLTLLPVEVDPDSINEATSRVITPQVISAYKAAAGDFVEAVRRALPCATKSKKNILFYSSCRTVSFVQGQSSCGMPITIRPTMVKIWEEVYLAEFLAWKLV